MNASQPHATAWTEIRGQLAKPAWLAGCSVHHCRNILASSRFKARRGLIADKWQSGDPGLMLSTDCGPMWRSLHCRHPRQSSKKLPNSFDDKFPLQGTTP